MTQASEFREQATNAVRARLEALRALSFAGATNLPAVEVHDIVIAGKEVQLTLFRQVNLPFLPSQVLITVQIARFGLGGIASFLIEQGLVFSSGGLVREAEDGELRRSSR